ncbi:hypothetical protein [Xenorhabdus sp. NBAII XenSa04]|uniref:hypothetical protein n=1 Tax=Xenorhabdus sp. NBAII XenSa04 TaxID=1429873 RepID=UPI001E5813E6|nr:hypothetical protein [Xenorhabdus sp. NBAII XenSa04]
MILNRNRIFLHLKMLCSQYTQGTLLHFLQPFVYLLDIVGTRVGIHVEPFGLTTRRLDLLIDQSIEQFFEVFGHINHSSNPLSVFERSSLHRGSESEYLKISNCVDNYYQ